MINIFDLTELLFLALKLTHQINWSWGYVLLPFFVIPSIQIACALMARIAWMLMSPASRRQYQLEQNLRDLGIELSRKF